MFELKTVSHLPQGQRLEGFVDLVCESFFPMSVDASREDRADFSGQIQLSQLSRVGVAAVSSSPLDVYRRRRDIAKAGESAYLVKVQVQGESLVRQRGREAYLQPGDFAMCLSSEPYELHFKERYSQIVLAVPQAMLEECVTQPQRHLGVRMRADEGANGLFSQFVGMIGARLETMDGILAQRLEANVIDLLCTTLGHAEDAQKHDLLGSGVKDEYLARIKTYIRNHLSEESLTPAAIAARHDISIRYLHMLFVDRGESVSRYIQRLRLEACESAFREPAFASYSVSEIAYRFGFNDASHFSRVFKRHYGETPARWRKQWLSH